jgi:hypothetical protein
VSDGDVQLMIEYMINKSVRLHEAMERRAILNETAFYEKHLLGSTCLVRLPRVRKRC